MKISKLREFRDRAIDNVRLDFYPAYDAWGISFSSSPEIIYIRSTSEMSRKLREIRRNYILGQVRTYRRELYEMRRQGCFPVPYVLLADKIYLRTPRNSKKFRIFGHQINLNYGS